MATVKELRAKIAENREELKAAIESASGNWDAARPKAEEALTADIASATRAAIILGGNPPAKEEAAFDSAAAAVAALTSAGPENDRRYSWAEDRDLGKQAPADPLSNEAPPTLESVMQGAAEQLATSAQQIKGS